METILNFDPVTKDERFVLKTKYSTDEECVVCLTSMKGCTVLVQPCGHTVHLSCHKHLINSKIPSRYNCPICRKNYKQQILRFKLYDIFEAENGGHMNYMYQQYISFLLGEYHESNINNKRFNDLTEWIVAGLTEEEEVVIFDL